MMKQIKKIYKTISTISRYIGIAAILIFIVTLSSCEENVLPEAGSIPDLTPPTALFSATQGEGDGEVWKDYSFSNQSSSATTYTWDFGDGATSTDEEPTHTYPGEGTYTITLIASDALNATSTFSNTIEIVEPEAPSAIIPTIHDASFENDDTDGGATGDGRDSWRISGAEIMQITSSPVYEGEKAGKFPSSGSRNAYQELTVSPNTDYILTYYYTMKTSPAGTITVGITPGTAATFDDIASPIASFSGSDQTDANEYVKVDLPFNTGSNSVVGILISNEGNESRIDSFSIDEN